MAVLTDQNRADIWADFMRELSSLGEGCSISKTDLRMAINDVDAWVDNNASAFNLAISQPARGALNAKQKARLLLFVVRRRYEVS